MGFHPTGDTEKEVEHKGSNKKIAPRTSHKCMSIMTYLISDTHL